MAVKIRLQRKGRTKAPFYHIVIADSRSPRDGRFIEKIGTYNPLTVPATIELNRERAYDWLYKGAQPTDTARAILRFKGVLYQKHLERGVKKGALTPETATEMLASWIEKKETRIEARKEATKAKKLQYIAAVDGTPKFKAKPVVVVEEPTPAEEATATEAVVASAAEVVAETAAEETPDGQVAPEETPAAEEAVEETPPAEEPPAAEENTTEA